MDARVPDSLREGERRARSADHGTPTAAPDREGPGPSAPVRSGTPLLALQRTAGNAAVAALMSARGRPGGNERAAEIDAAAEQAGRSEPDLPVLEKGLRAAAALGVAVDLDGAAAKPPASALAVTRTGFGPASVPDKKPAPPAKPTPPASPLAAAARRAPAPAGGRAGAARAAAPAATAAPLRAPAAGGHVDPLAAPVPPARTAPTADPAFTAVTAAVGRVAGETRAHPPAAAEAQRAQDAALAPSDDVDAQAKAAKVDSMDAQPAGSFDKKAFIAAVTAAVDARSPKNLEEADQYQESGKAGQVKSEVSGLVAGNTRQATAAVETATAAAPDTGKAVPKAVTPMAAADAGRPPAVPDPSGAVPKPAPAEQLNLAAGKNQVTQELADAEVSEDQLARSNEPEFTGALAAKQEAAQHADTAPGQFRQQEATVLDAARASAGERTQAAVTGMHGSRAAVLAAVTGHKAATKTADEAKRAEVTAKVQAIFTAAETEVKAILDGIDPKVDKAFEQGEKAARAAFEGFVDAKMSAFKKDRYGGWLGGYRWLKDKISGPPPAVTEIFAAGKERYLQQMEGVISGVADIVGADLGAAKRRIAAGKAEIAGYVKSLPGELKAVGSQAAEQVGGQFDRLENDVAAKQDALAQSLAAKYAESRQGLDDRVEALQAENAGLVDKAIGAVKKVVQTIRQLKDMLLGVLARAAGVIGTIISDPIGFLGKFVNAIKTGISNFAENIWEHLKKGLQAWLFGTLSAGGVEIPETLDLKGVLRLIGSILGLTWTNIRSRIVKKIGEPVMSKVESGLEVIRLLATEGIGGLWKVIQEKVGDLKDMVLGQIQDMVVTQIIKAGVTWLVSMLNPAGAFIKACKMIYDVVMFFVERASQIKEFVDSVLDSVESIAGGGVGAVASKIEQTLAKMLPVVIGFLASALGLGGISEKIKKILETVQRPIGQAIDWVVGKAVGFGKKFLGGAIGKVGAKVKAGKAAVKAKVDAAKAWGKAKVDAAKARVTGRSARKGAEQDDERSLAVKRRAHDLLADRTRQPFRTKVELQSVVSGVLQDLRGAGLKSLTLQEKKETTGRYDVVAVASPPTPVATATVSGVDSAAVDAAKAEAVSERKKAEDKHAAMGSAPGQVWASGGGRLVPQGAGEAPVSGETLTEKTPWVATQMAMFTELGAVHDVAAMTTLTPEAKATLSSLQGKLRLAKQAKDKVAKAGLERAIQKVLRSVGSYLHGKSYAGATKAGREAHSDETGEWLPRRSPRDQGIPGYADLVHAEKTIYRLTGAQAIGVSTLPQCFQCQLWFRERAIEDKKFIVVASDEVRVFLPDGTAG